LDLRKEYATPLAKLSRILGVPEQVIGLIAGRKFDNEKGLAWRGLIIKRKKYGVSDGFRNARDPQDIQADQSLTNADRGKIEQKYANPQPAATKIPLLKRT